jgi:hypothetical protein
MFFKLHTNVMKLPRPNGFSHKIVCINPNGSAKSFCGKRPIHGWQHDEEDETKARFAAATD